MVSLKLTTFISAPRRRFPPESSASLEHGRGPGELGVIILERVVHVDHVKVVTSFYELGLFLFPLHVLIQHVGLEGVIVREDRPVPIWIDTRELCVRLSIILP